MFTGIIERTGRVVSVSGGDAQTVPSLAMTQLIVDPGTDFATRLGDSVAINGCCLTVTNNKLNWLSFDVSSETLARTSLGRLREGAIVNLERAMQLSDRLGGHIVSGHVDGLAVIDRVGKQPGGWTLEIVMNKALGRYFVSKGSIAVDGVSLTVNAVNDIGADTTQVSVMLIPTTVSLTTFQHVQAGDQVNIEVDLIAKYVERLTRR